MKDTLTLIADLQTLLKEDATVEELDQWWAVSEQIKGSLYYSFALNKIMRGRVQTLNDRLTECCTAIRDGLKPNYTGVRHALSAINEAVPNTATSLHQLPLR